MKNNNRGFTLAEMMVGLGVSSFLFLTMQQITQSMVKTSRNVEQKQSINEVVFQAIRYLERQESCTNSLVGLDPAGAGSTIPSLKNAKGNDVITIGKVLGSQASRVQVADMTISQYENNAEPYYNGTKQATITLTFYRGSLIGETSASIAAMTPDELSKRAAREGSANLVDIYQIPVSLQLNDAATPVIDNCSFSVSNILNDIEKSCEMLGGTIIAGKCQPVSIDAQDGSVVGNHTELAGASLFADGNMIAGSVATTRLHLDTDINPDFYNATYGFVTDSFVSRSLGVGDNSSNTIGSLDVSGNIYVGASASTYAPAGGVAVAGNVAIDQNLYIENMPVPSGSAEDDRIIVTAKYAADQIADAVSSTGADITTISNDILAGGDAVARETILRYMCENTRIRSWDSGGAGGPRSVSYTYVFGVWAGGLCYFNNQFKRNCSVPGACETINTSNLCVGGNCKTRWPYAMKGSCSWQAGSSCGGGRRLYGRRNNFNPNWHNEYLCCTQGISDVGI